VGDVYETEVLGFKLAWKRIPLRRQVGQKDLKEMEILKKLSHTHMIKLIGTYTHRQCLGLLLEPVARLDLHSLFDDIEAYWSSNSTPLQHKRLVDVYFYGHSSTVHKASPIYFQIGCLVSAVAYLHDQKIRHKDLKPSNILLTPTSLILSDFGSATDFSLLSQSATDNERGTPKYFAPEVCVFSGPPEIMLTIMQVAEWEPNGRAADIFSLGCILLEILTLDQEGTLDRLRAARSTKNTAYYANLDRVNDWIPLRDDVSPIDYNLIKEIRAMLSHNPDQRPSAQSLLERLRYCDKISSGTTEAHSIFGSCCRLSLMKKSDHEEQLDDVRTLHYTRIKEVDERGDELQRQVRDLKDKATKDAEAAEQEIKDMEKKHRREMKKARHPEITGAEVCQTAGTAKLY
jgi:serine/threonine protein kinase